MLSLSSGTTTAPRNRQPQNAATHSGLFSPHKSMRWPFAIPRDSNSRAVLRAVEQSAHIQRPPANPAGWRHYASPAEVIIE